MTGFAGTSGWPFVTPMPDEEQPLCVGCGQEITNPSLIRLGSTSCHDCPRTVPYPMRFQHP